MHRFNELLINGRLVAAQSNTTFDVINPATEEVIGSAADASEENMLEAIATAREAFDQSQWSTDIELRSRCLRQLQKALQQHQEELRDIVMAEVGCPILLTRMMQLDWCIEDMEWDIQAMEAFDWEQDLPDVSWSKVPGRHRLYYEPIGVVAAITPWNYPLQTGLAKLIPALAAGNAVIWKPAPDTPLSAAFIARLIVEHTDVPDGIVSIVTAQDPASIGDVLTAHPAVDMVSFTGSTAVGKHIIRNSADTVKKTVMELGGKSPKILLDDADFESEATAFIRSICMNAGQGCAVSSRLLVPRERYEEVLESVAQKVEQVQYGDPTDPGQMMGPVINRRQYDRVLGLIETAKAEGARVISGGGAATQLEKGFYIQPTILAEPNPDSTISQTEVFGPVGQVTPYDDEEEAIAIANNTCYGLAATVASADEQRALAVAKRIRAGAIGINGASFKSASAPYGGYKQSGNGREYGDVGFKEYMEVKVIGVPN